MTQMAESRSCLPRCHNGGIYGLVVHNETLISGGGEGTLVVQDGDGGAIRRTVTMPESAGILDLALVSGGRSGGTSGDSMLLIGHMRGAMRMDPVTGACEPLAGPTGWVRALACDSSACAAVGDDKQLWYWTHDAQPIALAKLGGILHDVALSRVNDQHMVATIDSWRTLQMSAIQPGPDGVAARTVWCQELADDDIPIVISHGDAIAVAGDEGPTRIFDASTGDLRQEIHYPSGVSAMYWDRDGLVTGHRDLQLRLWSPATGACEWTWASGHRSWINAIARVPGGYATGDDSGIIAVDTGFDAG